MRRATPLVPPLALLLLALAAAPGCAIGEKQNRRTLNALDAHAAPESAGARWALAPVALPVGLVAGATDMLVVHPACVVDDAWRDTVDLLWTSREESRFRRALFVPLAAAATPFVWVGDWLGRAMFAIPPHEPDGEPDADGADIAADIAADDAAAADATRADAEGGP